MAIHQSAALATTRRVVLSRVVAGALTAAVALPAFAGQTDREQRLIGHAVVLELLGSRADSWAIDVGFTKVHRGYVPLASPICATPAEIDARLTSEGLSAEPRIGLSGPDHGGVEQAAVGFVQEWRDAAFAAVVRGDRRQACIVGVAKG
jgi:hypothetical protein